MSCGKNCCKNKEISNRAQEWRHFSARVENHIETYAVPQYGDWPNDPLSEFTESDIKWQIRRYVSRMDTGARGDVESMRDLLKLAHYACLLYNKREPSRKMNGGEDGE